MILYCFSGDVFSEYIEGGRADADIELLPAGISAMVSDGRVFNISYSECRVRIAGFSGRRVFCRSGDKSFAICCTEQAFSNALCEASRGLLDVQFERQRRNSRREPHEANLLVLNSLMGIALLVAGAFLIVRH